MFCPRCGTQNRLEQKYCRQCGHQLTGHRVALEGNFEVAATNVKKGEDSVGIGLIIFGLCFLNIVTNYLLGGDALGLFINLAIGVVVALPFIIVGLKRVDRANELLNPKEQPAGKAIEESQTPAIESTAAPITDRSLSAGQAPASVTEHTTLDLKERSQRQRSNEA